MSRNSDTSSNAASRLVYQAQIVMQNARAEYWSSLADNNVTDDDRKTLQAALMQYYDALRRYRSEQAVKDTWDDHDFDALPDMMLQPEPDAEPVTGSRRGSAKQVLRPKRLPAEQSVRISYELDDIAAGLGFAADINQGDVIDTILEEGDTLE